MTEGSRGGKMRAILGCIGLVLLVLAGFALNKSHALTSDVLVPGLPGAVLVCYVLYKSATAHR
jgi:hypothetical protein